jgi:DNA-binding GntR family transcriptional regulator
MLADKAYKALKRKITRGHLQPGQRLVERDLSRELSVSRIPLRESLVRLECEGLVRSVPNSATYVEDFSAVDVLEMYSMRLLLEPLAARLAAKQDRFAVVRKLRALCDQMTACTKRGDWAGLDEADYAFHRAVVDASKHSRLIRAYETSHIQVTGVRRSYTILKDLPPQTTAAGHHLIVQYIKEGDADRAERASYDHVSQAMRCLEQHLQIWVERAGRPVFRPKQDIGTSRASPQHRPR